MHAPRVRADHLDRWPERVPIHEARPAGLTRCVASRAEALGRDVSFDQWPDMHAVDGPRLDRELLLDTLQGSVDAVVRDHGRAPTSVSPRELPHRFNDEVLLLK